jgi:hypothetical protein
MRSLFAPARLLVLVLLLAPLAASAQARLTSPEQFFGHRIGADYQLPNYTKFLAYFQTLARESDRMQLDTIGRTEEGRPQVMGIISSPANLANKERYKQISARLSRAEGLTDDEARRLAKEGKAIVWIDGGLHATEVLGAQQLIETTWQLVSRTDEETLRFLDDIIILVAHANPDGMELVSDWYMREPDSLRRSTSGVPRLYEKYAGHDNNRDSYMNALAETRNVSRVMYTEWYPQIMYNHHQTGPQGTVMFAPPFRDPMNYNLHPLIITGIDLVGASMHGRFVAEKKGGTVMRSGASYSTWWNGGLRTTAYFHNQLGLLTETIGNPTPITIPLLPNRQLRSGDQPLPVEPGRWHFRQSIDYSVTANWAVLDIASRHREQFLYNIYSMGRDGIEAGNRDSWTIWPQRTARMQAEAAGGRGGAGGGGGGGGGRGGAGASGDQARQQFQATLRRPEDRDPRAYILSAAQGDYGSVVRLMRALQYTGVDIHRATAPFSAGGKQYPAGSFVVMTGQAFRPMVLDLFEPQDHPNDFRFPGAPPTPPYDNAGWTLAMQFGVEYDRMLDAVTGPFEKVNGLVEATPAAVASGGSGWLLDPAQNDAALVANRLLKANAAVFRTTQATTVAGVTYPVGSWFVPRNGAATRVLSDAARTLGVRTVASAQPAGAQRVRALRIGVVDRYGGLMPAGWTRLILETFEFPHTTVFPQELDAGNLNAKYDVLIFVDGMIGGNLGASAGAQIGSPQAQSTPAEFQSWLGSVTSDKTIPAIKAFVEAGGTAIAIGGSTALGRHLGLPIENHLVENGEPLPREKYYIPGSLLEVAVDRSHPLTAGLGARATVMFDNSPVLKLGAGATGIRTVARFDSPTSLRSGWAWGQAALQGGIAVAEASIGRGTLLLSGPEILFRAQPHGTFKFVFNALYGAR